MDIHASQYLNTSHAQMHLQEFHCSATRGLKQIRNNYIVNCSQVKTTVRMLNVQMNFPETGSNSLCESSLVMQSTHCSSCLTGWPQKILEVKMLDVEVQNSVEMGGAGRREKRHRSYIH